MQVVLNCFTVRNQTYNGLFHMMQIITADIYHGVSQLSEILLSLLLYILCRIHSLVLLGQCDQSDAV